MKSPLLLEQDGGSNGRALSGVNESKLVWVAVVAEREKERESERVRELMSGVVEVKRVQHVEEREQYHRCSEVVRGLTGCAWWV